MDKAQKVNYGCTEERYSHGVIPTIPLLDWSRGSVWMNVSIPYKASCLDSKNRKIAKISQSDSLHPIRAHHRPDKVAEVTLPGCQTYFFGRSSYQRSALYILSWLARRMVCDAYGWTRWLIIKRGQAFSLRNLWVFRRLEACPSIRIKGFYFVTSCMPVGTRTISTFSPQR